MRGLLLLILFAGCLPHEFARSSRGDRQLDPIVVQNTYPIAFKIHDHQDFLIVHAFWPRTCRRDAVDVITTETGTVYASNTTSSIKTYRVIVDTVLRACSIPAPNTALVLTFANGQTMTGRTGTSGTFISMVPAAVQGQAIVVTAPDAKPEVEMRPVETPLMIVEQTIPQQQGVVTFSSAMSAVRDVVVRCGGVLGLKGVERVRLRIRKGKVTGQASRPHEELGRCIDRGLVAVTFPNETNLELTMAFLVGK